MPIIFYTIKQILLCHPRKMVVHEFNGTNNYIDKILMGSKPPLLICAVINGHFDMFDKINGF